MDGGQASVDLMRSGISAFEVLDVDEHLSGKLADEDELAQCKGVTPYHGAHGIMRCARLLQVSRGGVDNGVPAENQLLRGLVERGPANSNEGGNGIDLIRKIRTIKRKRKTKKTRTLP